MAFYAPQSQSRAVMEQKRALARELLGRGLTVSQIATQLRCSPHLVRQIRTEAGARDGIAPGPTGDLKSAGP
jgi:transposase-like protein